MKTVTRFAPSPTGFLHIGGARTALFNWLFARHTGGKFLLRIEDTDKKRSTQAAIEAIVDGMQWLDLNWDGDVVYQSKNQARHAEVAHAMLEKGAAYKCYATAEELQAQREAAEKEGKPFRYPGTWRDKSPAEAPKNAPFAIRLKAPQTGDTVIHDLVQGEVRVSNNELDDMIILRSDGTPTYMLAAVVDDYDMGVTHIIRGDDHLTNAFRQKQIFLAMGWAVPEYAHIPLIHGPDGAKLSKRHGALGVDAYRDMGYLPEALRNYLTRLGWSHGDDEIFTTAQAVEWFTLDNVGKSPARFDFTKLANVNAHYIKQMDDSALFSLIAPELKRVYGAPLSTEISRRIQTGMKGLKLRANTLPELVQGAMIYIQRQPFTEKAQQMLNDGKPHLPAIAASLQTVASWQGAEIKNTIAGFATAQNLKLGQVMPPIRAAVCGTMESPDLMEVLEALGKEETLTRLKEVIG